MKESYGEGLATHGVRGYLLEAEGTVRPLLAGVAAPEGTTDMYEKKGVVQGVASLALASWNQIASWLKRIDNVRQAA
jgi:hypothetical protein